MKERIDSQLINTLTTPHSSSLSNINEHRR